MRILIIDKESRRASQLRVILSSLGMQMTNVHTTPDRRSAFEKLRAVPHDVMFLHREGGDQDAYKWVRHLREVGFTSVKLIVYGSLPSKEEVKEAAGVGADTYLAYPFSAANVETAFNHCSAKVKVKSLSGVVKALRVGACLRPSKAKDEPAADPSARATQRFS